MNKEYKLATLKRTNAPFRFEHRITIGRQTSPYIHLPKVSSFPRCSVVGKCFVFDYFSHAELVETRVCFAGVLNSADGQLLLRSWTEEFAWFSKTQLWERL